MTTVETAPNALTDQQLGPLFQYTVEAYKTFQKMAEKLPNPITAGMFAQFATDERVNRDMLELKISTLRSAGHVRATLGSDMLFEDILEGNLSYREQAEFLIARERAVEKKLTELNRNASPLDRNLLIYLIATKRAHVVELERELELIKLDPDWFKREDAQWRTVHGAPSE